MAKIFPISNEASAPDWFINQPVSPAKFAGTQAEADRIAGLPSELTEDGFTAELDVIEKCASTNATYFYNAGWDKDYVDRIAEFAVAYNVKAVPAIPSDPLIQEAKSPAVVKTASAESSKIQPITIADPFQLDTKGNMDYMKKADWQQPSTEAKAISPSIFMNPGAVIRMSGSEDVRVSSHLKVAPGQNSVTNPNAIKDLSEQVDTGARLRQEAKDHASERDAAHKSWETELVQKSRENPTPIKGGLTSGAAVPPTLSGGKAFGSLHLAAPEKTDGEQLGQIREERRKDIQRNVEDGREWDGLQGTTKAHVSDLLLAGLEERMNKIASSKTEIKKS